MSYLNNAWYCDRIGGVFTTDDSAIIADVQENMGAETELFALRPVVLPTDGAAVRARAILRKRLKDEEQQAAGPRAAENLRAARAVSS